MKILIIGANGQLGSVLLRKFSLDHDVVAPPKEDLDLSLIDTIIPKLEIYKPDIIINAAAYTKVDLSEKNKKLAYDINANAVTEIAKYSLQNDIELIHYSTDYVFDGKKNIPYTEIDNTNPINFYGLSKLKGEEVIIDSGCKYLIIRTSWVYGDYGNNFPNSILKKASQSKDLNVVNDQLGSPTHVDLISDVTEICIKEKIHNSLYHLCANGCVTWYEFANFLVKGIHERGIQLKCSPDNVWPKESRPSKSIALRPKNSVLNCDKIENEIKKSLPEWQYHANHYLDNWAKNYE